MKRSGVIVIQSCTLLLVATATGCTPLRSTTILTHPPVPVSGQTFEHGRPNTPTTLEQASWEAPPQTEPARMVTNGEINPFLGLNELSVDALVQHVVARNPSLVQMTAAWQAASARYPQVTALDDPMFGATIGPSSIGSKDVNFAYRLEVAQKLPFPGKLGLKGQSALSEAAAMGNDVADMRLQLIESAKSSFYEYYLVHRAIAVNEENLRLLAAFRDEAKTRYEKALVPQQDVLQAELEVARQQERVVVLERMRKVALARLNTLMHLPTESPLPPPANRLTLGETLPPVQVLRTRALNQRPDLQAQSNRIAAEEAALGLALKEFYPDFEVMAAYDAFWQPEEKDLRPMVGVRLNLPVQRERRHAAVAEAQARVTEKRAQLDSRVDQVNLQVQEAYEQVTESEKVVGLYEKSILPAARSNVEAARSAYESGRIPFLSLIEAQRNQVQLLDRYHEAMTDYFRRRATLERVVGGPLTPLM